MFGKIKIFLDFIKSVFDSRKMIGTMALNDFKVKYASSALGMIWAFIQPSVQILVLIFVFQVGFRSGDTQTGVPFALWLTCGLVPWNFFSDAVTNGSNSLYEYSYLVKKVVFRTSILPIVKLLSSLIVHLVFIWVLLIVSVCMGVFPTIYTLQIFYYLLCMMLLITGLNWLTASLAAFFKDISQLITVILQLMIWLTPILWNISERQAIMDNKPLYLFFKANPMFYIVDGYRDAFTGTTWFWEKPWWTLYFLAVSSIVFTTGALVFHKLRPHFSDVL